MDAWVPFFQTLLWILWVSLLIWVFRAKAEGILEAIRDRILKGSAVEAGPFKLGANLSVQKPDEQRRKLDEEVAQIQSESGEAALAAGNESLTSVGSEGVRSSIILAEELAIREIQAEFGVSLNRQIRMGDARIDGMFVRDGSGYAVEVKYLRHQFAETEIRRVISQVEAFARNSDFKRLYLVVALVVEDPKAVNAAVLSRLNEIASDFQGFVQFRTYLLPDLVKKYGL